MRRPPHSPTPWRATLLAVILVVAMPALAGCTTPAQTDNASSSAEANRSTGATPQPSGDSPGKLPVPSGPQILLVQDDHGGSCQIFDASGGLLSHTACPQYRYENGLRSRIGVGKFLADSSQDLLFIALDSAPTTDHPEIYRACHLYGKTTQDGQERFGKMSGLMCDFTPEYTFGVGNIVGGGETEVIIVRPSESRSNPGAIRCHVTESWGRGWTGHAFDCRVSDGRVSISTLTAARTSDDKAQVGVLLVRFQPEGSSKILCKTFKEKAPGDTWECGAPGPIAVGDFTPDPGQEFVALNPASDTCEIWSVADRKRVADIRDCASEPADRIAAGDLIPGGYDEFILCRVAGGSCYAYDAAGKRLGPAIAIGFTPEDAIAIGRFL